MDDLDSLEKLAKLKDKGIIVKYHLLVNSQKKGTSGGIHSYQQVRRDLLLTVRQARAKRYFSPQ